MTIRQGSSRRSPPEADDEGSLFAILEVADYEFKAKERKPRPKRKNQPEPPPANSFH